MPTGQYKRNSRVITIEEIEQAIQEGLPTSKSELAKHFDLTENQISYCLRKYNRRLSNLGPIYRDNMLQKRLAVYKGLTSYITPTPWYYWFVGFVDGEGCFSLTVNSAKLGYGLQFQQTFSLRLHEREESLLQDIGRILKLKHPAICRSKKAITLTCRNIVEIATIIIPIFNTIPLHSAKRSDFELFKESLYQRIDRTLENTKRCVEIYQTINTSAHNHKRKTIKFDEEKQWFTIYKGETN